MLGPEEAAKLITELTFLHRELAEVDRRIDRVSRELALRVARLERTQKAVQLYAVAAAAASGAAVAVALLALVWR
jgi:hypothetical protein